MDWLVYHHGHRRADRPDEVVPSPVTDFCGYDQGRPAPRGRRPCGGRPDAFAAGGEAVRSGLAAALGDRRRGRSFAWRSIRRAVLPGVAGRPAAAGGRRKAAFSARRAENRESRCSISSSCWRWAGRRWSGLPLRPAGAAAGAAGATAGHRRGATGGGPGRGAGVSRRLLHASRSWAGRDRGGARRVQLGKGEYFVLGDNSPISDDSRTWAEPAAVSDKYLIGKPLAIILPVRYVRWGPWHFQVPDLARIRYIR